MSGLTRFCELHRYEQQVALEARQLAIPRSDANLLFLPQLLQNGQCCSQGTQGNHTAMVWYREGQTTMPKEYGRHQSTDSPCGTI